LADSALAAANAASPPFFIVGSGRSGSTLLRMMLTSHSRLLIPPETWFLLPLVDRLPIDRALTSQEVEQAIALMTGHYRWPDMKIGAEEFRARAHELGASTIRDLVQIVYGIHLDGSGKKRWGDKTPPYVRIIPQLASIFPGARFLCLVRDGRDVTKSFQSLTVYGDTIHQNTVEWVISNQWQRKWAATHQEAMLQVKYEDLVVDPESALRKICRFIGEEFEPGMLSWQQSVEELVPTRELHVHQKLKRTSNLQDIERWKREMTNREIFVAEAFIGGDLRRLGYPCRFQSPLWRPLLWLTWVYCRVVWRLLPAGVVRMITVLLGRPPAEPSRGPAASSHRDARGPVDASGPPAPGAVDPTEKRWTRFLR
jgi:hypothetical protein